MRSALRRLVAFYALQARLLWTWRLGRRALARRLVLTTVVAYLALGIAVVLVPGILVTNPPAILAAVFAIALLNALLRPVVLAIAVPLGIAVVVLTGIALQVAVLFLVGSLVPGVVVRDLRAAFEGAIVFAVANTAISWFIALGEDESYFSHLVRMLIREHAGGAKSDRPGVVIVQIDGLSHPVLVNQIRAGRVPTMARWTRSRTHSLTPWECRLPSQTSASQAGILLGSNDGIPAFRWFEKDAGRLMVSNRPPDAFEIERRLGQGVGLLAGGASIGNLFTGGAAESLLTMSRLGDPLASLGPTRSWFYFLVSPFSFARALFLTLGEAGKEVFQARRQRAAGIEPRIARGGAYPLLRAFTNVFLRQITVSLLVERMLRGVPVMYVDFVDYDEIAHHAGPERGEALDALDGIDHVLGALEQVAAEAPRPYRFVVLSDHGQSQGATFRQRYGITVEGLVRDLMGSLPTTEAATATVEAWGPLNAFLSEVSRGTGAAARMTERLLRGRSREGFVELGPGRRDAGGRPAQAAADGGSKTGPPGLVVCASGNLALVYLDDSRDRMTLEAIEARYPRLVDGLTGHDGIGFVMVRSERLGAIAIGASGRHVLDGGAVDGRDPLAPFGAQAAEDLRRLDSMPHVGDLVLNSRIDEETQEVAAFEELVGSHGGIGGWQTKAFVLHPSAWVRPIDAPLVGAPAIHRLLAEWLVQTGVR